MAKASTKMTASKVSKPATTAPKASPVKKRAPKPKNLEETGENLAAIVETSQNTFKSKFETLYSDIIKALPKNFKEVVPTGFQLGNDSIPHYLTLEIPTYSERTYWIERMTVRITWNKTATGNVSKALPIKFTLI